MLPPDAAARERALDITSSFLVQAPAGSGKTELLTQRFLALLAAVENPESIVAITFTRKAAGEMRSRIAGALAAAQQPRPEKDHAQRTWELARAALQRNAAGNWGLLENPSRLRIMTLDALCTSLTGQMPWMSRMGGQLGLVDDPSTLHHEAALRTLALLEQDSDFHQDLATLLLHLDNNFTRAAEMLMGMLANRDQWLRHIVPNPDRELLESSLRQVSEAAVDRIRHRVPFNAWDLMRYAKIPLDGLDDLARHQALADFLLTQDGTPRKRITKNEGFPSGDPRKPEMESLCRNLDADFAAALDALRGLPPPEYSDKQWRIIEALAGVLKLAVAQLRLVFQERRATDFIELTLSAAQALGTDEEPTPLAYALDFRIQHLLLDEFQDTSRSKLNLLERLIADWAPGDGRTVFAVGDPMQSIYRFQEADVSLFEQCRRHGLGRLPLEALTLRANFRSSANLIDWFNNTFPQVLAAEDDPAAGAVIYSPSVAQRDPLPGPAVSCHPVTPDNEPAAVANIVEQAEGKVAILVRRRVDAHPIVAELKRRAIPFQAVDMDPLSERSIVQDLRALTRALLHPADRVAWLSILRAPWCGLELADLFTLPTDLSTSANPRLQRVAPILQYAVDNARRRSLRRQVEETWRQLGGPACLRDEAEKSDALAFFRLLDTLDEAGDLTDFALLDEALEKLYAAPDPTAPDQVQIMTMHKSKGLEFDNVILPGLSNTPRSGNSNLLRWAEPSAEALLIGCIRETGGDRDKVYEYLGTLESAKDFHEAGRLLYVAATRAKSRLHLVASQPTPRSFLQRLWHAVEADFPAPVQTTPAAATSPAPRVPAASAPPLSAAVTAPSTARLSAASAHSESAAAASAQAHSATETSPPTVPHLAAPAHAPFTQSIFPAGTAPPANPMSLAAPVAVRSAPCVPLRRVPDGWQAPAPPPALAWPLEALPVDADEPAYDWSGETVRLIGTLVHRVLQQIAQQGVDAWSTALLEERRPALRTQLAALGVPRAELETALARTLEALRQTLTGHRGRWILANHPEAVSEWELCGVFGGNVYTRKLDRTFVADGIRWIIDYKTGVHEGGGADAFLDREQDRYRPQLEQYAELVRRLDPRPIRLGLYFPLMDGWREWEPTAARPAESATAPAAD